MHTSIKNYLAAYNFIAFAFWAAYLVSYVSSGLQMNSLNLLLLNIAQGMAVLEVLHALLKWVKSPVVSTSAQVASRILVLVFINLFIQTYDAVTIFDIGVKVVSFAWGITELVRYSLYFLGLFNKQPASLLWMRYSFFIVLYPMGVTGEWLILLTPVVANGIVFNFYTALIVVLLVSYLYYFPVLYKYMWKQRKAKI